jgi:hypothetical protein
MIDYSGFPSQLSFDRLRLDERFIRIAHIVTLVVLVIFGLSLIVQGVGS